MNENRNTMEKYSHLPQHNIEVPEEKKAPSYEELEKNVEKLESITPKKVERKSKPENTIENKPKKKVNLASLIYKGVDDIQTYEIEYKDYIINVDLKPLDSYQYLQLTKYYEDNSITDYGNYLKDILQGSVVIDNHYLTTSELAGLPTPILFAISDKIQEISNPDIREQELEDLLQRNARY